TIASCLQSLAAQRYPRCEIILADDRSTDATGKIAAARFPAVRCVRIERLPENCAGKSHALSLARRQARGEWLLFTDADTVHEPDCLSAAMNYALRHNLQMLSLLPEPVGAGFWEHVLQPIIGIMLFMIFPIERINSKRSRMAFANGQYILISGSAYDRVGGHGALLEFPLEDIAMAQNVKRAGLGLGLVYADGLLRCRMYQGLRELWNGWERIFYLVFSDRAWLLPPLCGVIIGLSIIPYLALCYFPALAVLQLLFLHLSSERAYAFIRADRRYIVWHPLGCAILIGILWCAFWKKITGRGVVWKGKRYHAQRFLAR
ncbi:MAG: glycosyltransferase family 2 protein, partial [Candidatus Aureabacteria bacterium]|nr:glycosyltransferase family 2 protein [Candidatus Auribacterota bacterium]